MPRPTKPKPPTRRQREIVGRFRGGMSVLSIWLSPKCPANWGTIDIEDAIRAVMVWDSRVRQVPHA